MHYKDPKNNLHFLDDDGFFYLLPPDCQAISDEEAAQIQRDQQAAANPNAAILHSIATLESSMTPRRLREALTSGNTTFIKSIDAQIAVLRASLTA